MEFNIEKINDYCFRIPRQGDMRVDGIIYAGEGMMETIKNDDSLKQVANVACLPGIIKASLAMPDIHMGYGFPIGGVAAFDMNEGIISPGGVGYDINCGVRLIRTDIGRDEIINVRKKLSAFLLSRIPSGVGSKSKLKLSPKEIRSVLKDGAGWVVRQGYGESTDLELIEEGGCLKGADPGFVSERAFERGKQQLGTVGAGNHFVEIDYVEEVFDMEAASAFGLAKDDVTLMLHCGSRGLGHQICDDYIKVMMKASERYGIQLKDRQLCSAPVNSQEGKRYYAAMACAVNYAFANRQILTHVIRSVLGEFFTGRGKTVKTDLIYDVCHNIAKMERHKVNGDPVRLCVHRKGATRAFPAGSDVIPERYLKAGQPVLIPGDMGRCSYVLVGTEKAMNATFGSTCHGAGRLLSRHKAVKISRGRSVSDELDKKGVSVMAASRAGLNEELPEAYKDVSDVVDVVHNSGISRRVARLRPMVVIKG